MEFSSPMMHALERSLDGFAMRHQAIADNIANINTPGYVKQDVNFEQSLIDALKDDEAPKGLSSDPMDPNADMGPFTAFDGMRLNNMHPLVSAFVTDPHNAPLLTWQPHISRSAEPAQRLDGNHVPVETEMAAMVSNATKYQAITQVVSKEFGILRNIAQAK